MIGRYGCLLSVLLAMAVACQPFAYGDRETQPTPTREATVRFDLYQDYLIVARGSAGPLKGLNFVLDTGANPTVLDRRLARKLHLEELPASMASLEGSMPAGKALVPSLEFGPVRRANFPVMIQDLSFFQNSLPIRIDAVVGLDVLSQSTFMVDYIAHEIHFGPLPPMPLSLPLRGSEGLVIVNAELNHVPVHLLLDTGAPALVLFQTKMSGSIQDINLGAVRRATNMIGKIDSRPVSLHSLRLGTEEFKKEPAVVVQNRNDLEQDFDGLMSPAALGLTKVAIDLERGVLAFSR